MRRFLNVFLVGALALGLLAVLAVFGFSHDSYTVRCVACLAKTHSEKWRLFGVPVGWRNPEVHPYPNESLLWPEGPQIYQSLFGMPCRHVFKRFGMSNGTFFGIGCGQSAEGVWFKPRVAALEALFALHRRLPQPELARKTYAWIDSQLIATASVQEAVNYPLSQRSRPPLSQSGCADALQCLAENLKQVKTEEEWRGTLEYWQHACRGGP